MGSSRVGAGDATLDTVDDAALDAGDDAALDAPCDPALHATACDCDARADDSDDSYRMSSHPTTPRTLSRRIPTVERTTVRSIATK